MLQTITSGQQTKIKLRRLIKEKTRFLSTVQKAEMSAIILQQVEKLPQFQAARVVLLFHSLPDEVCTHSFVKHRAEVQTVLLPVVVGDNLYVAPYEGESTLCVGSYGICEPTTLATYVHPENVTFALIPGVAFDRSGHRLGRGKGFYDRFLSLPQWRHVYKCGICFPHQLFETIPTEVHDVRMDCVITI